MSRLEGDFMDSQNIIIINDIPHFSFSGNSYLEKLKNGLPLDLVFAMEDYCGVPEENFEECVEEEKQYQPLKHELFAEEYDCEPLSRPRKGKNIIKKPSGKNMKKNKVKQNGYDDKLHNINVNLSSIYYEEDKEDDECCCGDLLDLESYLYDLYLRKMRCYDDYEDDYSNNHDNYSNNDSLYERRKNKNRL